jgi:hypothetical protein
VGGGFFVKFSTPQDQDSLLFQGFAFFCFFENFYGYPGRVEAGFCATIFTVIE